MVHSNLKNILIGLRWWLESYVFQTSHITAMCPTTSVGWWQKNPNWTAAKIQPSSLTLHHCFAPTTFALMFAGWDDAVFFLGGFSDFGCLTGFAGHFLDRQWSDQCQLLQGRSNRCWATSGGVEEAYFRHKSWCLCPLWSCTDHLSIGPAAHWDPGSEDGWAGLECFHDCREISDFTEDTYSRSTPWNQMTSCKQNLHHLTTCRPLLQIWCEQVPLSATVTVKLLILQSEMLSLDVWWRSIALFDLLLWHATLQSNNGSVLKPRSHISCGNIGDNFSGQPVYSVCL